MQECRATPSCPPQTQISPGGAHSSCVCRFLEEPTLTHRRSLCSRWNSPDIVVSDLLIQLRIRLLTKFIAEL